MSTKNCKDKVEMVKGGTLLVSQFKMGLDVPIFWLNISGTNKIADSVC